MYTCRTPARVPGASNGLQKTKLQRITQKKLLSREGEERKSLTSVG